MIGGLFFGHAEPGKFIDEHEELLIGIAGQAATAIDKPACIRPQSGKSRSVAAPKKRSRP